MLSEVCSHESILLPPLEQQARSDYLPAFQEEVCAGRLGGRLRIRSEAGGLNRWGTEGGVAGRDQGRTEEQRGEAQGSPVGDPEFWKGGRSRGCRRTHRKEVVAESERAGSPRELWFEQSLNGWWAEQPTRSWEAGLGGSCRVVSAELPSQGDPGPG